MQYNKLLIAIFNNLKLQILKFNNQLKNCIGYQKTNNKNF